MAKSEGSGPTAVRKGRGGQKKRSSWKKAVAKERQRLASIKGTDIGPRLAAVNWIDLAGSKRIDRPPIDIPFKKVKKGRGKKARKRRGK
jgi:hypothetical protein